MRPRSDPPHGQSIIYLSPQHTPTLPLSPATDSQTRTISPFPPHLLLKLMTNIKPPLPTLSIPPPVLPAAQSLRCLIRQQPRVRHISMAPDRSPRIEEPAGEIGRGFRFIIMREKLAPQRVPRPSLPAKACWGVRWAQGFEYLTTSDINPMAVLRSERSRKSVEQGIAVGWAVGCHCLRSASVRCKDESFASRSSRSEVISLVGFARERMMSELSVLSSRWPILDFISVLDGHL